MRLVVVVPVCDDESTCTGQIPHPTDLPRGTRGTAFGMHYPAGWLS